MMKENYSETNKEVLRRLKRRNRLKHDLIIRIFVTFLLVIVSTIVLYLAFYNQNTYSINKVEKAITNYRVYMNKDDIYNKDYQESGFSYVSSTIDYIKANYNYELKLDDKNINTKYDYEIKSILTIKEPNSEGKVLYTEEFQELDKKEVSDTKDIYINEDLKIDYKKYNQKVENYKRKYGVSVEANVRNVMIISEKSTYKKETVINEVRELSTTIPLGEQTLTIDVNNPIDSTTVLKGEKKIKISLVLLCIGIVITAYTILRIIELIVYIVKYENLKTNYDIKLSKILKEYDRIIVETDAAKIKQDFKNIISVNEFEELVDVRDNTEQPILFVERAVGRHANFMVINNETLYVYDFDIEKLK